MPADELTTAEAAELLGVDTSTVYRMWKRGDLPARLTPKGHRRYARAEVERIAAGLAAAGPVPPSVDERVGSLEEDMAQVKRHLGLDQDGPPGE